MRVQKRENKKKLVKWEMAKQYMKQRNRKVSENEVDEIIMVTSKLFPQTFFSRQYYNNCYSHTCFVQEVLFLKNTSSFGKEIKFRTKFYCLWLHNVK